jgi:hypothetical protein
LATIKAMVFNSYPNPEAQRKLDAPPAVAAKSKDTPLPVLSDTAA